MKPNRTFDSTKQQLADLDEHYLEMVVEAGEIELEKLRESFQRGDVSELCVEVTEVTQQLAEIGLWVVQREQQSRRN